MDLRKLPELIPTLELNLTVLRGLPLGVVRSRTLMGFRIRFWAANDSTAGDCTKLLNDGGKGTSSSESSVGVGGRIALER